MPFSENGHKSTLRDHTCDLAQTDVGRAFAVDDVKSTHKEASRLQCNESFLSARSVRSFRCTSRSQDTDLQDARTALSPTLSASLQEDALMRPYSCTFYEKCSECWKAGRECNGQDCCETCASSEVCIYEYERL